MSKKGPLLVKEFETAKEVTEWAQSMLGKITVLRDGWAPKTQSFVILYREVSVPWDVCIMEFTSEASAHVYAEENSEWVEKVDVVFYGHQRYLLLYREINPNPFKTVGFDTEEAMNEWMANDGRITDYTVYQLGGKFFLSYARN